MSPMPRALSAENLSLLREILAKKGFRDVIDRHPVDSRLHMSLQQLTRVEQLLSEELMTDGITANELNSYGVKVDALLGEILPYIWQARDSTSSGEVP